MDTVEIKLPADLVQAAGLDVANPSTEASRLLALELYRENRISLGTIFEQGLGLFGSPEDAALPDEVVSIAYEERRRPTKPLLAF